MPRIYLVVQNHVRTGPFTLTELLQQPLQAHAMVWIIGQSEDWLSPLEIPGLQGYFTQQSDGTITANEAVLEAIRTQRFTAPATDLSAEHQRAGVLDAQLLEQTPTDTAPVPAAVESEPVFAPRVVSVAGSVQQDAATAAATSSTAKGRTREKEEDNISIAKKNWAVVGIALVLILFITWNAMFNDGPRIKRNKEYAAAASALDNKAATVEQKGPSVNPETAEGFAVAEAPAMEDMAPMVVPSYGPDQDQATSTDAFLDSVQRVLDAQEQLMVEVDDAYRKSFLYRKRHNYTRPISKSGAKRVNPMASSAKSSRGVAKVPLSQQVDMQSRLIMDKRRQQVNSVEVMVKNNSQAILKTVSVDVYYYRKGEKLLNKETVYFSNLYPKQSLTKSIAGNHKATSARFQLGTITTTN